MKKVKVMRINKLFKYFGISCIALMSSRCSVPPMIHGTENKTVPANYNNSRDSVNMARVRWRTFFTDPNLHQLIDTALRNNQELNILLQDINIAKNEVRARK